MHELHFKDAGFVRRTAQPGDYKPSGKINKTKSNSFVSLKNGREQLLK